MNKTLEPRSIGTIETRRIRQPWQKNKPFKILSIDGGGICGILPASILANLERKYLKGEAITSYFDMITGTSTGGIIALGLAKGLTGAEIRDFYLEKGEKIFPYRNKWLKYFKQLFGSLYDTQILKTELASIFHDELFGTALTSLCIPSFDGKFCEPYIYKTPHHPDYKKDKHEKMLGVALATAAAPTFFPIHLNDGYIMVDGALVANNPIMIAIIDALACYDIEPAQIHVLSLGCASVKPKVDKTMYKGGKWKWQKVHEFMMHAQSHNSLGQACLLVGKNQILRLDDKSMKKGIPLDDFKMAKDILPQIATALVDEFGEKISKIFLKQ